MHAAAPCPVEIKKQMIDWWGPIIDEYYASSEAIGSTLITAEDWLAHPGSVGKPMLGGLHILDEDGKRAAAGAGGRDLFRGRLFVRIPQRPVENRCVARQARLDDRRRHRLPRRRRLPVPDRPAPPHDHLRRGEHLSAGSREPSGHPPEGVGRRGVRHSRRRDGATRRGAPCRRSSQPTPPTSSPTSCSAGCEIACRTTSVRARSRSRRSCRAPTPESSTKTG